MTKELSSPDFALGFHERWEVYLHERQAAARADGEVLTPRDETEILDAWYRVNYRTAYESALCHPCADSIAQALLEKRSPFAIPESVKKQLATQSKNNFDRRF